MPTILITGFGPFPGAPFNPTIRLVRALARLRRPALADTTIVTHVFQTRYSAVDRELPDLVATFKPDALLMFGLHGRARAIRIETQARNRLALLPDAAGNVMRRGVIAPGAAVARAMPMPAQRLLAAARRGPLPAVLSHDAGRYLCNYLCWRAGDSGVRLAAFVHVPPVARFARPKRKKLDSRFRRNDRRMKAADLLRAGEDVLVALNAAVNRT